MIICERKCIMDKKYGKVVEVFIPEETVNERKLDVMDSKKIGFKVQLEDKIIEVIQEQDEHNSNIMKNDNVIITIQNISGKEFIDIELLDGDMYE